MTALADATDYKAWWDGVLAAPKRLHRLDIIGFIAEARDAGDLDEAIWRTFLAGHFGGRRLGLRIGHRGDRRRDTLRAGRCRREGQEPAG